jgi:hypothetical protein
MYPVTAVVKWVCENDWALVSYQIKLFDVPG